MSAVSDLFDRHDRPECGTPHGAARHHRDGEPACEACLEARREYQRDLHEDAAARKPRPERTAVVAQMKALDAHRAARAALREQTRVDL